MRKISSLAICVFALSCAGTVFAAKDSSFSVTEQARQHLRAWVQQAQSTATRLMGSLSSFDASAASRARPAHEAFTAQPAENTGNAMLVAGLLVMGVIIKRRSGQRD
jgi:hypothetical protein